MAKGPKRKKKSGGGALFSKKQLQKMSELWHNARRALGYDKPAGKGRK